MTLPAWFEQQKQDQNRRSKKQEQKIAKEVGGRRVAGSGSSWRQPGDVKNNTHLIEAKFTDKDSYSLSANTWEKVQADAHRQGKEPAMVVELSRHNIKLLITELE